MITTIKNKANVVTFKQTTSSLIKEFYDDEKKRIIEAATRLIKSVIKVLMFLAMFTQMALKCQASRSHFSSSLHLYRVPTKTLFVGKDVNLKIASVGQAIMQSVRPRVLITPLQLGLGVQMHRHFSSKFLIDSLNSHGFSVSYKTVKNYERSAAV